MVCDRGKVDYETKHVHGVYIGSDFIIKKLNPSDSFEKLVTQVKIPMCEWKKPLEENVETLLTLTFQYVFDGFDLLLVTRERPLLQVADLIAIDGIGRLTLVEIKTGKPKSSEVVAQATKYLVECGNLASVQVERLLRDYYANLPIFAPLYIAGLLTRRRVESGYALSGYLKKCMSEDDAKYLEHLAKCGGSIYFQYYKEKSIQYILEPSGVNVDSSVGLMLRQATGVPDISPSELSNGARATLGNIFLRRFRVDWHNVDINRQWRIVYFSQGYSFEPEVKTYLTEMHRRGLDMRFFEYHVYHSSPKGPWILGWRERDDWCDEDRLKSALKKPSKFDRWKRWKNIGCVTDEFILEMARRGFIVKKRMAGDYEYWDIIKPNLEEIGVTWPADRNAMKLETGLETGEVNVQTAPCNIGVLKKRLEEIKRGHPVDVELSSNENRVKVKWQARATSDQYAKMASMIVSEVISWYRSCEGQLP